MQETHHKLLSHWRRRVTSVIPGQGGLGARDEGGLGAAVGKAEGSGQALGLWGVHQAEGGLSRLQRLVAGVPGQVGHTGLRGQNLVITI